MSAKNTETKPNHAKFEIPKNKNHAESAYAKSIEGNIDFINKLRIKKKLVMATKKTPAIKIGIASLYFATAIRNMAMSNKNKNHRSPHLKPKYFHLKINNTKTAKTTPKFTVSVLKSLLTKWVMIAFAWSESGCMETKTPSMLNKAIMQNMPTTRISISLKRIEYSETLCTSNALSLKSICMGECRKQLLYKRFHPPNGGACFYFTATRSICLSLPDWTLTIYIPFA
jgi:hypothetical protein